PFNARTRKAYEAERWTGYEVVLDVFPDVIAYGILLLPKDLKEGEKRPVVVCQHGLEGRPQDTIDRPGLRGPTDLVAQTRGARGMVPLGSPIGAVAQQVAAVGVTRSREFALTAPGYPYYKGFAAELAERGFITFAPQNLYIFQDRFRTLQRKANPLGKTLFSIMVPQHQQITDWLKTLPQVDPARIGFYGLSYGGQKATGIPPP